MDVKPKVGSKWRLKAVPGLPVLLVRVNEAGVRYQCPRSGFQNWVPMAELLVNWEPCDAAE